MPDRAWMRSFGVDLEELHRHGYWLSECEPFGALADAAARLLTISEPPATAAALQRFTDRLRVDLATLSQAAGSLSRATRHAADGYQAVEGSIVGSFGSRRPTSPDL